MLRAPGPNGVYVFTGLPGLQTLMETDLAALFRDMVLKNQVVLRTVNAGPHDFRTAIADLEIFHQRWPEAVRALLAARTPIAQAVACMLGRPAGIKSAFSS